MHSHPLHTRLRLPLVLISALLVACGATLALASPGAPVIPTAQLQGVASLVSVERLDLPALDVAAARAEDPAREEAGLPPRFAIPQAVDIAPETNGTWETLPDPRFLLWQLHVTVPNALSLNIGFDRYRLPKGGRLVIYPAGPKASMETAREFTERDNQPHGQLWTPVVLGDEMVIELTLPAESRHDYELHIASINAGYRFFGEPGPDKSGSCNVDVICPQGDDWRHEIPAIGVYTVSGSWTCSGSMINNTSENGTPYFLSAYHCGVSSSNAASVVVYWNFESPTCGQQGGGSLSEYNTGAIFRARSSASDFCLVQLEELPDPSWQVTYAGWDRTSAAPNSAVCIHHPNCDEKSISFENDPTSTTSYLGTTSPGDGSHIRITDWDVGTTEPGSSGSPLFSPGHHIVGQLHGGYAACGNDESDWFGRLSVSWSGGGTSATRLSDWLDPLGTAPNTLDTYDPYATGLAVTPSAGLSSEGPHGGPFTPSEQVYTLENESDYMISYQVTADAGWIVITGGAGSLTAGGSTNVTVSIGAAANSLVNGAYSGTVTFTNLTDGLGNTTRPVSLLVGTPQVVYSWPLDTNPGWTTQGQWAFGHPTGGGGQHGSPDPTNGHTGTNVYGYNLSGDYANYLSEQNLTSTAVDCSDLSGVTLRFYRWLGVEQPTYDHAYVRVSNNGTTWTTIWQNTAEVADASWQLCEYDISAVADGQPTVYLRWTMGTTDGSWQYCGWNLDDIEIAAVPASVPSFVDVGSGLPGISGAAVSWFEHDGDTDLDLLLAGDTDSGSIAGVYANENQLGVFSDRALGLPGVTTGAAAWGDYDRDGDLDLLLAGQSAGGPIARIYRNDGAVFVDSGVHLEGVAEAAAAWGDYDNDGDLDLVLTGTTTLAPNRTPVAHLYRNDGGSFTLVAAGLPAVYGGDVAWGDYDGDGDLDLVLEGNTGTGRLAAIYRNDGGSFVDSGVRLPGLEDGSVAWGDYDADGDLDLLVSGQTDLGPVTRIYANSGGSFTDVGAGLPGVSGGNAVWGDCDGDGDLDIALAGTSTTGDIAAVYLNDGGGWTDLAAGLPGVSEAAVAWGHLDADGDLDLLLTGDMAGTRIARVYRNDFSAANAAPAAPGMLQGSIAGNVLTMSWAPHVDDHTPMDGLSYSVRVGTTAGGVDVVSPQSDPLTGWRYVAQFGLVHGTSCSIAVPPGAADLYWSVQSIDGSFLGSPFAAEEHVSNVTGVEGPGLPRVTALRAIVPNPFNPAATIAFDLPAAEHVQLAIYDASGRRVRLLLDEDRPAGTHEVRWDGRGEDGRRLASGVYMCRMKAGDFSQTKRVTLVR